MTFVKPQKSKIMLEISQVNKREKLNDSTKLVINCTYGDLLSLNAALYTAILRAQEKSYFALLQEFKKLYENINVFLFLS